MELLVVQYSNDCLLLVSCSRQFFFFGSNRRKIWISLAFSPVLREDGKEFHGLVDPLRF
jgi:hypothetical protein